MNRLEELEIQYAKRLTMLEAKKRRNEKEYKRLKELEMEIIEEYIRIKEEKEKK